MERFVDERRDDDDEPREMIAIGWELLYRKIKMLTMKC